MNSENCSQCKKFFVTKFYGFICKFYGMFFGTLLRFILFSLFSSFLGGWTTGYLQFIPSYERIWLATKNFIDPPSISKKHFVILVPWIKNAYGGNESIRKVIRSINQYEGSVQIIELAYGIIPNFINEDPNISWREALRESASNTLNTWQADMVIIGEVTLDKEIKLWTFYSVGEKIKDSDIEISQEDSYEFEEEFIRYISDDLHDMAMDIAEEIIEDPQNRNNDVIANKISNLLKGDLLFSNRHIDRAELYEIKGDLTLHSIKDESMSTENDSLYRNAFGSYELSLKAYKKACQVYANNIPIKRYKLKKIVERTLDIWHKIINNYIKMTKLRRKDKRNLGDVFSAYDKPVTWFNKKCIDSPMVTSVLNEDEINNVRNIINEYIQNYLEDPSFYHKEIIEKVEKIIND